MASITLSELRTRIIQHADLSLTDQFITTAELNGYINLSISKLWDLATETDGQLFVAPIEVQLSSPTTSPNVYSLATTAYKVVGVELWADPAGSQRLALLPAMPVEIPGLMSTNATANTSFGAKYRVYGGLGLASTGGLRLEIYPPPGPNQVVNVRYLPPAPILVDDSTPVRFPNGWEEFVVLDAAIKCIGKEEGDTRELQRQRDELAEQIRGASASLDRGSPEVVQDVSANRPWLGWWGGWGGDGWV